MNKTDNKRLLEAVGTALNRRVQEDASGTEGSEAVSTGIPYSLKEAAEVINEVLHELEAGTVVVSSKLDGTIIGFMPISNPTQ